MISGRRRGIERAGEDWARRNGVPIRPMPTNRFRPDEMVAKADALIVVLESGTMCDIHMAKIIGCVQLAVLEVFAYRESFTHWRP